MLDSFSIQVVEIIEDAKKVAAELGDVIVGTEHLLLAMYETPDSICRFLLQEQAVTYDNLLDAYKKMIIIHKVEDENITFSNKFQEIIWNAKDLSIQLNSNYVYDEHLFYALLKEEDAIACEIMRSFSIDLHVFLKDIEEIFNFFIEPEKDTDTPFPFLLNLSKTPGVHPYVKRSNYIERIQYILLKKQKNNPLLIGSAGVGKTAIIEGLSKTLENDTIYQLDLGSIVAGTKYRGELEEKLIRAMEYVQSKKAILFIDEIHNIVGAGSNDGSLDIANILKPYLSRSDIRLIGATTLEEYYRFIEKDKALMRRFQNIFIDEPSPEEVINILLNIKSHYEAFHNYSLNEFNINDIINKCNLYLPTRHFPDKAIDVMDEVGARIRFVSMPIDDLIDEVVKDMSGLTINKAKAIIDHQYLYEELKPYYLRFVERVSEYNNIASCLVDDDFQPESLFDDLSFAFGFKEEMFLEIDLDSYHDINSVNNLIGSPKGYVGYDQGGILSEHIIKYPLSVVYFKNISKAHISVERFIKNLQEKRYYIDNKGRKINLQNVLFLINISQNVSQKTGFIAQKQSKSLDYLHLKSKTKAALANKKYEQFLKKYGKKIEGIEKMDVITLEKEVYDIIISGGMHYKYEHPLLIKIK